MKDLFKRFVSDESGQDLIEYALLAGFISLVAVTAITNVGTGVDSVYGDVEAQRSGPRNLDSGLSEISIVFQAAVPKPVAPKYTTSGVRRPSEL